MQNIVYNEELHYNIGGWRKLHIERNFLPFISINIYICIFGGKRGNEVCMEEVI
jgi:hypothetical protein